MTDALLDPLSEFELASQRFREAVDEYIATCANCRALGKMGEVCQFHERLFKRAAVLDTHFGALVGRLRELQNQVNEWERRILEMDTELLTAEQERDRHQRNAAALEKNLRDAEAREENWKTQAELWRDVAGEKAAEIQLLRVRVASVSGASAPPEPR